MTKPLVKRRFYIHRVNCDCSSYISARSKRVGGHTAKCDLCKKKIGLMQFKFERVVIAATEWEAIKFFNETEPPISPI